MPSGKQFDRHQTIQYDFRRSCNSSHRRTYRIKILKKAGLKNGQNILIMGHQEVWGLLLFRLAGVLEPISRLYAAL